MGVPPSLGFFSEILVLMGVLSVWYFHFFVCFIMLVLVGFYNIYLFVSVGHGVGGYGVRLLQVLVREHLSVFFSSGSFFWLSILFYVLLLVFIVYIKW